MQINPLTRHQLTFPTVEVVTVQFYKPFFDVAEGWLRQVRAVVGPAPD